MTAVAPGGNCTAWLDFLNRLTAGDREMQAFLQRMFGYTLTGVTSAHALFFLFGTGANGKSVCFMDAEDAIAAWIDERCIRDPQARTASQELFVSWKAWADQAGEFVGSAKRFAQNLEARGFSHARRRHGRGFQGIAIDRSRHSNGH